MARTVTATEFKAKCLAFLDDVSDSGPITVTKRGRPVATLQPMPRKKWQSPAGSLRGKVEVVGDIANLDTSALWNCAAGEGS